MAYDKYTSYLTIWEFFLATVKDSIAIIKDSINPKAYTHLFCPIPFEKKDKTKSTAIKIVANTDSIVVIVRFAFNIFGLIRSKLLRSTFPIENVFIRFLIIIEFPPIC